MPDYTPPAEFATVPHAGNNRSTVDADYARQLVARLDAYERSFMAQYQARPDTREAVAHHNALFDSGLTEAGLATARGYAGKKRTSRPGVLFPAA